VGSVVLRHKEVAASAGERPPWHGDGSVSDEAPRFLLGLIDGMRCGILAIDRHGRLAMVNDLGREILGLESAAQPPAHLREALADHPQLTQVLLDSFTMASLPNRAELELHPGSARGKTIGYTLSMIPGRGDETLGAAIFFKDLTPIEQREEQERLRDRLAELGQMTASLAHEIRNPLASIEVTCSLIRRRLADERDRSLLDKVNAEVQRLDHTITSSLEFVRPLSLDLGRARLKPILEEAIRVAQGRHGSTRVEVLSSLADVPPFLMDRERIRQVFENLLLNAFEAISGEGQVNVEVGVVPAPSHASIPYQPGCEPWQRIDRFAVISVADTGRGIGTEEREKIFYPFFTTKKDGSGVGLSTVKKIVSSHQGLIDVDASPSGGARFTVRLPMVQDRPEVRAK
jgi:signal transduction histidine kinase